MVVKDKCFRELKKLCEDKEYVAYETAFAFTHTLQELLEKKPWRPDKNYLVIIEMLTKQVDKTVKDIKQNNPSEKLKLKMINSVYAKTKQIKDLEKKLREQAICYMNDIYSDIDKALKVSVLQANQTHSIIQVWDVDLKEPKQALNRDLVEHVKNSSKLLEIAKILGKYKEIIADKRKFALVHFSSKDEIKTDIFIPGEYFVEDMMDAAEHFFCGCTDFVTPLNEAVRQINDGFENADITIITDGECNISNKFCEEFKQKLLSSNATMTGILLDKHEPCGKVLEQFCDKIYHSREITEDEIAIDILNRKAA